MMFGRFDHCLPKHIAKMPAGQAASSDPGLPQSRCTESPDPSVSHALLVSGRHRPLHRETHCPPTQHAQQQLAAQYRTLT
jgi:hypothetical protein